MRLLVPIFALLPLCFVGFVPSVFAQNAPKPHAVIATDGDTLRHAATATELQSLIVRGSRPISGMAHLAPEQAGVLYAGKKNEVVLLDSLNANTAGNNPRQTLGRVPGAVYSETEGAGFPSNGIGFRGLDPSQSVEVQTRQNGYNIVSDVYGYPETYYLPPLEAVARIEVVRGAGALAFGAQFGGVINYVMREGSNTRPLEVEVQQTGGSFGFFNSFAAIGGQSGRWNYYGFAQYKASDGERPNSDLRQATAYARAAYQSLDGSLRIGIEYSLLRNRIHMAGGLTDAQFESDPRASYRARNWIETPWNVAAATLDYRISSHTSLYVKTAVVLSSRNLVWRNEDGGAGALDTISATTHDYTNREVERETFRNTTTEARLVTRYAALGQHHTLAAGIRFFTGTMHRQGGGEGTTGTDFNLDLLDPHYEYDLAFSTTNAAVFAENTFQLTPRLTITPGVRYEYLRSTIQGYKTTDGIEQSTDEAKTRSFALFGAGAQLHTTATTNVYANVSEAYRPIDYAQLTPFGTTARIDPNMKDASGYNADAGFRGTVRNVLNFDIGAFYIAYRNRVGTTLRTDATGNPYTLRTNVADSEHKGIESYVEFSPVKMFAPRSRWGFVSVFNSFAYIDARYTTGEYVGKMVEYAPNIVNRAGVTYTLKGFSTTFLVSHTSRAFADATNTERSDDANVGAIPAATVFDLALSYRFATNIETPNTRYIIKAGINNLTDLRYTTKRTDEYPGPGIIPALGRSVYVTLGAKF